jgi:hypothetical protein
MSESGCLHNNKYESVEVENHIESNKFTVTEEIHVKNYQMSGPGKLSTSMMYSCGNGAGQYNVKCHKITSTDIAADHTAEGSSQDLSTLANEGLNAYNNYFMGVTNPVKDTSGKIDFTNSSASTYKAFVEWPPNSILYDLTIIPSRDIQTVGLTAYSSGAAGTAERNNREIVVNLFTVNTSTNLIEVSNVDDRTTAGPVHDGTYPAFDKGSYLIREFPILAAPAATTPASKSRWFKHTPLCVVREGGLPMEIVKPSTTVLHQHATSSTGADSNVVVINHGSGDPSSSTVPTGRGDDTSAINRSNGSNEPWTDFSFNNIQRRKGTADRPDKKTMIKGFKTTSSPSDTKSISKMGQFYNHSVNVGLMLNIGTNNSPSAAITPPTGVEITSSQGSDSFKVITHLDVGDTVHANIQFKAIFTFKKL